MYNQTSFAPNAGFGQQSASFGSQSSQFGGMQKSFQPTGFVQSAYKGGQSANVAGAAYQPVSSFQYQTQQSQQNPQSFHTANYRGSQAGHDNYLRADATSPSSSQYGMSAMAGQSQFAGASYGAQQPQYGMQQSGYQQTSPQSYHLPNYHGNQPGHDISQRADSQTPAQHSQYGQQAGMSQYGQQAGMSQYGQQAAGQSQYGQQAQYAQQAGQSQYGASSFGSFGSTATSASPTQFHAANYRGNQPGHDISQRADSQTPAQHSQFGFSQYQQ